MDENLDDAINRIINYTNDNNCKKIVEKTIRKYREIDAKIGRKNSLSEEVYQSLLWVAETTRSSSSIEEAAKCFLLDDVISIPKKYNGNVLSEVFENLTTVISDTVRENQDLERVKKYVNWVSNGWISKLLLFVSEFPGNGNVKIQSDIFSLIGSFKDISAADLDKFNEFALYINRKRKLTLEKKLEFLLLLKSLIYSKKEECVKKLVEDGIKPLKKIVEDNLGIKLSSTFYTLNCGARFVKDVNRDSNIQFLLRRCSEFGSIKKWLFQDEVSKNVIKELESKGFDVNLYVASGKIISQKKTSGVFSENLAEIMRRLVIEVVGSKRSNILPKISIPRKRPGGIFKRIKNDYFLALNQDREAIGRVLKTLEELIIKGFEGRKMPRSTLQILNYIKSFRLVLTYGGTFTYKGAKVTARVWKRKIPDDLYDSHEICCCWFLPRGEMNEIPLFVMDPKTTMLQFSIQGLTNPVSVAFFYAGAVNKEPALLVDTWEGGPLVYSALGQERMKDFVLEAMKKFAKKAGVKKLLIFANPTYGRAKEFINYLKDKGLRAEKVHFEAIDVEDSVLKAYSQGNKHHSTDAFHLNPLKGDIETFVINLV
ncbi:MAG: hypothetical protein QMD14_03405 [Candidatus Aenigmarchaeota archaeon]|nr:hypothetical protein [Candidatus Aenigmarchaeota archaeon]